MMIHYNSSFSNFQNILYSAIATMLDYYTGTLVFLEDKFEHSYNNYNWFKFTVDHINNSKDSFINYMYDIKTYPCDNWHNTIHVTNQSDTYEYSEYYKKITDNTNEQTYMKEMRQFYPPLYECENKNYICLLSKFNDILCVQHTPIYLKNNDIFEKSNMSILSVTYNHPLMEDNIELTLSNSMLYCHNQLFNFAFVYHCLQYQDKPYVFDENYKIEIMDSNVDTKEVKFNQYLHIYKDEIKIQSLIPSDNVIQ